MSASAGTPRRQDPAPLADLPEELIAGQGEVPDEEPAPLLGTWARWYAVVLGNLLLLILLFYWFTRAWA